ncbi:hypothetical protein NIT62_07650 [Mammaliicoccus sciuri]|nr:hypothetical protein NIT62_07650 [Mammaliicoccus sciuri]
MKKLIVLLLSSLLVLGACGEKKEESILDPAPKDEKKDKKETKKKIKKRMIQKTKKQLRNQTLKQKKSLLKKI